MDIRTEVDLKHELQQNAADIAALKAEAVTQNRMADDMMADTCEYAYKKGAGVAFIAQHLKTNRQRIYLMLASRGIHPGAKTGDNNGRA